MSSRRPYILLGGGSLGVEVASYLADVAAGQSSGGSDAIVSDVVAPGTPRTDDLRRVLGTSPSIHQSLETVHDLNAKLAVVCIGDPQVRARVFAEAVAVGAEMDNVIHPSAIVAPTASLGRGVVICPFVFVGPFARIGDNVVLNVRATIGHDAELEASCVVSPGAELNGFARVGRRALIGAGAVVHPRAGLGACSKLSAGSVLTKVVGDGYIMHGNPAVGRQMIPVPQNEGVEG